MSDQACPNEIYITAAFRSTNQNEAYIFMKKEYALYYYNQPVTSAIDKIVTGPTLTIEQFPFLKCTIFEDVGIHGAFASHIPGRAFIFAFNQVAEIDYAPSAGSTGKLVRGPMLITTMFPFLKGTSVGDFQNGIDAAFESSVQSEAYIFNGKDVGYINYGSATPGIISVTTISEQWPKLAGTIFENGIDAAYVLHQSPNEAFIFKGDTYARIDITPRQAAQRVFFGPGKLKGNRNALNAILPRPRK